MCVCVKQKLFFLLSPPFRVPSESVRSSRSALGNSQLTSASAFGSPLLGLPLKDRDLGPASHEGEHIAQDALRAHAHALEEVSRGGGLDLGVDVPHSCGFEGAGGRPDLAYRAGRRRDGRGG